MSALKITATAKPIMAPIIISFTSISKPRRETGSTAAGVVTSGATVTAMAEDRMILTLAGTDMVPNTGAKAIKAAIRASRHNYWPTYAVNSVTEKFMGGSTRLSQHLRNIFDEPLGVAHQGAQHPRTREHDHHHGDDELGNEAQSHFVDLGRGLKNTDGEADHQRRHQQHQHEQHGAVERLLGEIDYGFGCHDLTMPLGVEAVGERTDDQHPAVDQHEQHDLERQRDDQRRQHHHAHRHQHTGDEEVDDQKRNEDHETDLEGGLDLAGDERRHQRGERHFFLVTDLALTCHVEKKLQIAVAGLVQHESGDRLLGLEDRILKADLLVEVRGHRALVDRVPHRRHHEKGEEQREADQRLIGGRLLGAERLAQQRQYDDDAGECRHHQQPGRQQGEEGHEQYDLYAQSVGLTAARIAGDADRVEPGRRLGDAARQTQQQRDHQ